MRDFWSNPCFYGRCIKIVCRDLWKRVFPVVAVVCASGCVNIYERFPTTAPRIESVYQSTSVAAALTVIASFPQTMAGGKRDFMWENCLTIPFLGLPCAVDTFLEACVDTVCFPVDWPLAASRRVGK